MIRKQLVQLTVEEVANTLTHGFGLILSVIGFFALVYLATISDSPRHIVSAVIYGASLIVLYGASTFYHASSLPKQKRKLQILDHCCIYLLIAGTYTPFTLLPLKGFFGNSLFAFVWIFALIGIIAKIFFHAKFKAASVISYLIMGWIGVFAIQPLYQALGFIPMMLIVAGGLSYTLGTVFYGWHSLKHHHAVWHLFVLAGSALHFSAIAIYVFPMAFVV